MASSLAGSKRRAGGAANPPGGAFTFEYKLQVASRAGGRTVSILYTSDLHRIETWCREVLRASGAPLVLGLDTESPPNFRPGGSTEVTVLQLACSDSVLVVQLNALVAEGSRSRTHVRRVPVLAELVSRPGTVLAGMGVAGDAGAIADLLLIPPAARPALADLKRMAVERGHAYPGGLGPLAETILGVAKWKSKKLALSRWGDWPLGERQVTYAAMDAWASAATHEALSLLPLLPPPAPPPPPDADPAAADPGAAGR